MSIAAKTTIIRSERSPGERVKLLRYCLARLRAWEMEYRLYSSRSTNIDPPKRTVEHLDSPVETEGLVQPTEQEPIMVRNVPQPSTHYETPTISWESIVGAIDTHSISTTEMPYPVETPRATPPTVRHDEYALSHDAPPVASPSNPPGKSTATVEPVKAPLPANPVRTFRPLQQLTANAPIVLEKPTVEKLRIPKVVAQILGDVPEHWKQLAQGIESRVKEAGLRTLMVTAALRAKGPPPWRPL